MCPIGFDHELDEPVDCTLYSMCRHWTAPRIMPTISFALHFICITFKNSATSAQNE